MDVSWEAADAAACAAGASAPLRGRDRPALGASRRLARSRLMRCATLAVGRRAAPARGPRSVARARRSCRPPRTPTAASAARAGQSSSELYTAWAAMGLAAAGRNPAGVRRGGHSVLDSLRGEAATLQRRSATLERTILAVRACGASAYSLRRAATWSPKCCARAPATARSPHQVNLTAFAIFALRAAGTPRGSPRSAKRRAGSSASRTPTAASASACAARPATSTTPRAALQALVDAGARDARALGAAARLLTRAQNLDGGFPQQPGGESNAQSTAWAVQGLIAAGAIRGAVRRRGSRSPLGYLESLRAPGGSIRYSRTGAQTPVWVTAQALIALAGQTFPVGG